MGYIICTKGKPTTLSTFFDSTEFDCHGSGCCSSTPVNEMLVEYLDKIHKHFNKPITITSGYRCPTHNSRVGGATGSRHSKGDAADFTIRGVTPREIAKYAESIGIMGIGLYETNSDGHFVHIDTRTKKSFWYGQAEKPISTFGPEGTNKQESGKVTVDKVVSVKPSPVKYLKIGSAGSTVKELQQDLIRLGYDCGKYGADGQFGSGTDSAVRKFQKALGLVVDGVVGSKTREALDNAIKNMDASTAVGKSVRITASVLNVRSGAGISFPIKSNVKRGAICTVVEEKDGWGRIVSPAGWISGQYYESV